MFMQDAHQTQEELFLDNFSFVIVLECMWSVYLDNCCLNRVFDDQTQLRVHLESEAVKVILSLCEQRQLRLICSQVSYFEINKTPNTSRKDALNWMLASAVGLVRLNQSIRDRAAFLEQAGFKAFDALHVACAETSADVFLTVDDRLLKKAESLSLRVRVSNPLQWIQEVL